MLSSFAQKVKAFIAENQLLQPESTYLLALSGGCDSVALLHIMIELNYHVAAVHCNFQLRNAESKRDEMFCEGLCRSLKVPFHRVYFDTKAYASLHHVSIEMAARELRYDYFEKLRKDISADDILVAHHQDDNIETALLNLIRGTGIQGLLGMKPKNGHIIRPLLSVSRKEIEQYLSSIHQDYVTDSSNLVADVMRNKIRLEVIPLLKTLNPSVSDNISTTIKHLNEASNVLNSALEDGKKRVVSVCKQNQIAINIEALQKEVSPEYILYSVLSNYSFSSVQIENIAHSLNASTGKKWYSKTHELVKDRETLLIATRTQPTTKVLRVPEEGLFVWNEHIKFKINLSEITSCFEPSREPKQVTLDGEIIAFPLTIRYIKQGDRFQPFGMKGSKLVSDLLTNLKYSIIDKQQQLIVEDAHGHILWVVGVRVDQRFAVTKNTKRILTLTIVT